MKINPRKTMQHANPVRFFGGREGAKPPLTHSLSHTESGLPRTLYLRDAVENAYMCKDSKVCYSSSANRKRSPHSSVLAVALCAPPTYMERNSLQL